MNTRIDRTALLEILAAWDSFLKRQVRLIACGGTALTLLNVKASTKDIDFIIPDEKEYNYLIGILGKIGYARFTGSGWRKDEGFVFDLYPDNKVFTTQLLDSPLGEGRNSIFKEFTYLYIGILNDHDLLISKLFRGIQTDIEDCLALVRHRGNSFDIRRFEARFRETALDNVIGEDRVLKNLEYFLTLVSKESANGNP